MRVVALIAMVGVVLYAAVDVVLQCLPPYYSPISDAESNLAVGPYGAVMNLNFIGRAVSTLCAVVAIASVGAGSALRQIGLVLLSLGGTSSAVLAFFPTDIGVQGATVTGAIHLSVAGLGFAAAVVAMVLLTFWLARITALRATRTVTIVTAGIAVVGALALSASLIAFPGVLGLAERVCLVGMLAWVFVVCGGIRRGHGAGRFGQASR
ncbi:MAG: DUF998 domain-containing protein [Cryobacterium sp.]